MPFINKRILKRGCDKHYPLLKFLVFSRGLALSVSLPYVGPVAGMWEKKKNNLTI